MCFCKNCIGSGIIFGPGELRVVCSVCNGFGRQIIVNPQVESLGGIALIKKNQGEGLIKNQSAN